MTQDRFEELLGLLLDDDIGSDQMDELVSVVDSDPLKREALRQHLSLSDQLSQYEDEMRTEQRFLNALQVRARAADDTDDFVGQVVASLREDSRHAPTETSVSARRPKQWAVWNFAGWVTASLVLLALGAGFGQLIDGGAPRDIDTSLVNLGESTDDGVAVLTHAVDVQWTGQNPPHTGSILSPGQLSLNAGLIQVEFYNGVRLIVEGPADLEIASVASIICREGKLRTHVPPNATGFSVLTPRFELVDLGTEFAVDVSNDGRSDVHVFDGVVELYLPDGNRDANEMQVIRGGSAMEWSTAGTKTAISPRPQAFASFEDVRIRDQSASLERYEIWQRWNESLRDDSRIVARYDFESDGASLTDTGMSKAHGTIVGCERSAGRWPNKQALEFKRPGDRVRVDIPGEFDSLTVSAWVRVDALPRRRQSLLLTDGYEVGRLHWQIGLEGELRVGVRNPPRRRRATGTRYASPNVFTPREIGVWNSVCSTYDRPSRRVTHWFNGQKVSSKRLEVDQPIRIGIAEIGNWGVPHGLARNAVRNFIGRIDELTVWNVALNEEQITSMYENSAPW